jgi:hypothetical protein
MLRISKHKVLAMVAGAVSLMIVSGTMAEQKVPIKLAVQTTIGPSDAPVRTAVFTPADRQRTKVEPVWYGGRGFYGGRGWGGWGGYGYGYRPYYSYYRAPYVRPYVYSYLPAPYYNYYPSPAYTYYTPPTYYSAAPSYANYYPAPYYANYGYGYRVAPRRVIVRGGYYW